MKWFYIDKRKFPSISLVLVISLLLSGCAGNLSFMGKEQEKQEGIAPRVETLGLEPDFSYEKRAEKPNIYVDRLGYLPGSAKTAIMQGEELPEKFQVIEQNTGICVYEGEVRREEEQTGDMLTGYCNFTDLEEEGIYYIQCDKIGCSYYFAIGKEVYLEKEMELGSVLEALQNEEEKTNRRDDGAEWEETAAICETVSYLLTAYEMYPGLLLKIWEDGKATGEQPEVEGLRFFGMLQRKTDQLLSLQDEKTGGIYKNFRAVSEKEGDGKGAESEISEEATAAFAGTMAKYSYLYRQYDQEYAATCLKAAVRAWRYLNGMQGQSRQTGQNSISGNGDFVTYAANTDEEDDVITGKFYAASELYRASNEILYHNYILQNQELILEQDEDFYLLMGKAAYLSTKQKVDRKLCGKIMDGLMKEAEEITERTKAESFLSDGKETDVILWNMTVLALANYAVMNHEYVTVIENNMHYLMGRNAEAVFLSEHPEGRDAAVMLLLFSVAEAEREIVEDSESREK